MSVEKNLGTLFYFKKGENKMKNIKNVIKCLQRRCKTYKLRS